MMRMVRFEDVYLYRFDGFGVPQWMPKDEATYYPTSKMAHAMKRLAERYEGKAANIAVVKVRGCPHVWRCTPTTRIRCTECGMLKEGTDKP